MDILFLSGKKKKKRKGQFKNLTSTNVDGTTGYPHAGGGRGDQSDPFFTPNTKINSKWFTNFM